VNCVECFTPRLLFERAFDQLLQHQLSFKNGFKTSRKIDNVQQFVKCIRQAFEKNKETKYLVHFYYTIDDKNIDLYIL
jgi:origin recognition complex subunit 5